MPATAVRHARAFSLFELLLVVSILALVAGIAIPRFAAADAQRRTQLAASRFQADVELLQRGARAQGAPRVLSLRAGKDGYYYQDASGTVQQTDLTQAPFEIDSITFAVDGGGDALTATADGLLLRGGTVRFTAGSSYYDVRLKGVRTPSVDDPETLLSFGLDNGLNITLLGAELNLGADDE